MGLGQEISLAADGSDGLEFRFLPVLAALRKTAASHYRRDLVRARLRLESPGLELMELQLNFSAGTPVATVEFFPGVQLSFNASAEVLVLLGEKVSPHTAHRSAPELARRRGAALARVRGR